MASIFPVANCLDGIVVEVSIRHLLRKVHCVHQTKDRDGNQRKGHDSGHVGRARQAEERADQG